MQQVFRSTFGPKEVSPTLPDWLMGSWAPAPGLDIPINGLFVMALTLAVTGGVLLAMYRSRWGLRVRATVSNRTMANAIGIDTRNTDRLTFAIGCGVAGIAGAATDTRKTAGEAIDDAVVTTRVKAALIGDKTTKARKIDVETEQGIVQLNGSPTDNNATQVRAGYSGVATPYYDQGKWQLLADQPVPDWDPQQAGELFTQILAGAGEGGVDAVFAGNDALAGAVVQVLQSQGREPVLLSGQDATVAGVQNVLAGWQTMTVYKSIQSEASTAVIAALTFLNCEDVSTLRNNTVINNGVRDIPSILLEPVAVTKDNVASTVIAEGLRTWDEICVDQYEQFCPPAEQR